MHEVHCPGINRDVGSTEGGNGGSGSVESYEVDGHIAVVFEGRSDGEAGGEITSCRVNQHVDLLSLVLFKDVVNGLAVEVGTADETFQL